jgi:uncharacterized SAM-binding protein YcdF (DUF218 family)
MKKAIIRKSLIFFGVVIIGFVLIYALRRPLMRGLGNYLIEEDNLKPADAIFVLSGNPEDRAKEAAKLFRKGYAKKIICTGAAIPTLFEVINVKIDEATLSKIALLNEEIDSNNIELLHFGTSTREESKAILAYCKENKLSQLIVVSDKFHTNRIDYAFRSLFEKEGVKLILRGAPSSAYSEQNWWAEEAGLLMVNNEYVKLLYYYIHY